MSAGILVAHGFELDAAAAALAQCVAPPGRMQVIRTEGQPTAIVDFAHTPDALQKALLSAREHSSGKLWVIFGCGGDRDRGKRAQMGVAAARFADRVVVTSDNPRHENPQKIVEDICSGIAQTDNVCVETDRRSAIRTALDTAAIDDVVLIAGKGSESYQIIGDDRIPMSDIAIVAEHLQGASS